MILGLISLLFSEVLIVILLLFSVAPSGVSSVQSLPGEGGEDAGVRAAGQADGVVRQALCTAQGRSGLRGGPLH